MNELEELQNLMQKARYENLDCYIESLSEAKALLKHTLDENVELKNQIQQLEIENRTVKSWRNE